MNLLEQDDTFSNSFGDEKEDYANDFWGENQQANQTLPYKPQKPQPQPRTRRPAHRHRHHRRHAHDPAKDGYGYVPRINSDGEESKSSESVSSESVDS